MTIEEGLYAYLSTYLDLTALIKKRIYPQQIPESATIPAVTYFKVSTERPRSSIGGHDSITNTVFQISIFGLTYAEVEAIGDQVHAALLNYSGLMGTVAVQGCFCVSEIDGYDDTAKEYYQYIDYQITH